MSDTNQTEWLRVGHGPHFAQQTILPVTLEVTRRAVRKGGMRMDGMGRNGGVGTGPTPTFI